MIKGQLEVTVLVGQVDPVPFVVGYRKTGKSDENRLIRTLLRFHGEFKFSVDIRGYDQLPFDVLTPEVDLDCHQALIRDVCCQGKCYLLVTVVINTEIDSEV